MIQESLASVAPGSFEPLLGLSMKASSLFGEESFLSFITNSMFVALIVLGVIGMLANKATKNMRMIPSGVQNGFEFVIEFLYGQVEAIVGEKVAPRAFPLLATLFLFVLTANWMGLFPGVGTVGFGGLVGPLTADAESYDFTPIFRPATADLNMTLGMALCFMVIWAILTVQELGMMGFIKHTFGAKGGLTGFIGFIVAIIFFAVGLIEIVSIAFRPVSLSLRLFGNVYAGETLLHTMSTMMDKTGPVGSFLGAAILPLPFYFLEILIGFVQAMVFALLSGVYIKLSTEHDEEHGEHH